MPRQRRPRYGLRRAVAALLAGFILLVGVGVPVAILAPVPPAAAEVAALGTERTAAAEPVLPAFGSAAIGAVGMPGLLAKSGPQKPRSIASITKVVTALVVLQAKPLAEGADGPTITFSDDDVRILAGVVARQGSWQQVEAGWETTQRGAIETMLIPSANNYAETLAIWAFGSEPAYLDAARAYLDEHGLDDTTVVDSSGLDTGDRSTPADLVDLGRLALAEPVIAATVRKTTATEPNIGEVDNTNLLLGSHGVNGIKTGTTEDAGACLLFSAQVKVGSRTVQLVGVILGAATHPQLNKRVPPLLASVREGLHEVELDRAGTAFATFRTRWGGVARAVQAEDATTLVWGRAEVRRTVVVEPVTDGQAGDRVGTVRYEIGDDRVEVPLQLDRDVPAPPVWWRLANPLR